MPAGHSNNNNNNINILQTLNFEIHIQSITSSLQNIYNCVTTLNNQSLCAESSFRFPHSHFCYVCGVQAFTILSKCSDKNVRKTFLTVKTGCGIDPNDKWFQCVSQQNVHPIHSTKISNCIHAILKRCKAWRNCIE